MQVPYRRIVAVTGGLMLAGCAAAQQSYGNQSALSPDERELQALQSQMAVVNRRLDAIASAEQSSQAESEVRSLRGQLENLQHEVKQNQQQVTATLQNLNSRLEQLEKGKSASPVPASSVALVAHPSSTAPNPASPSSAGNRVELSSAQSTSEAGGASLSSLSNRPGKQQSAGKSLGLTEEVAYIRAFNLLQAGQLNKAVGGFQAFLKQYPDGEYADNALYWLGSAYYVENDTKDALSKLYLLLKKFPNSPKVPDAMVKIGIIYQNENKNNRARAEFNRVLANYPNSNAASIAKQRLDAMPH